MLLNPLSVGNFSTLPPDPAGILQCTCKTLLSTLWEKAGRKPFYLIKMVLRSSIFQTLDYHCVYKIILHGVYALHLPMCVISPVFTRVSA